MSRLREVLEDRGGSYILPFFWQHGEDEAVLREYMEAIDASHIREVCLECRPHPDFLGEKWWRDMDVIMEEAKKRGMGVWLLDDAHFPTGEANGAFADADPGLCKEFIQMITADAQGPMPEATVNVQELIRRNSTRKQEDPMAVFGMGSGREQRYFDTDRLLGVYAFRITREARIGERIDLTECVQDGILTFDVPAGMWRIYVVYYTQNGAGRTDYMNIISAPSVQVLIDQVYEPVYRRYHEEFGKTFRGFFSDEPIAGNLINNYDGDTLIGHRRMPLPWCGELEEEIRKDLGENWTELFPLLWEAGEDNALTSRVRFTYMDRFTSLVQKNFSDRLGNWCRERGVMYIGHLVEDSNRSATVNFLGNWARAMHGQSMAGIDCIGGGVMLSGENRLPGGLCQEDGDFYHFTLAKLAASLAALDPAKEGRSLVECFGAYGWNLGLREMKYIADHFLVRGINHYTPHAFSPKAFPDPDCPPHFYAHGMNPQYHGFGKLMQYMQRVCHLIDGGAPVVTAAILHSDMAAWCGSVTYPGRTARILTEHQKDFLFVFEDWLQEGTFRDGKLVIGNARFSVLIVPGYACVTHAFVRFLERAETAGFPVLFVGKRPQALAEGGAVSLSWGETLEESALAERLEAADPEGIRTDRPFPGLRCLHYAGDSERYFLVNEDLGQTFAGRVFFPSRGNVLLYDPMENRLKKPEKAEQAGRGTYLELSVPPFESVFVIFGEELEAEETPDLPGRQSVLRGFHVSLAEASPDPAFHPFMEMETPESIGKYRPDFSGFIRYEKTFVYHGSGRLQLRMSDAWEAVRVWCGDREAGERICPPYVFDLTGLIQDGENALRIEAATTADRLVRRLEKDVLHFIEPTPVLAPTGLVGDVFLEEGN